MAILWRGSPHFETNPIGEFGQDMGLQIARYSARLSIPGPTESANFGAHQAPRYPDRNGSQLSMVLRETWYEL